MTIFYIYFLGNHSTVKENSSKRRQKESFTQDIFSVMSGCENSKRRVIYFCCKHCTVHKYSHGVKYDLVEEIETEYVLEFINEQRENRFVVDYARPVEKKCRRSLPATVVTREIPEYYGGKREGPGELPHVQNLGVSSSYSDKSKGMTMRYLMWLEIRKLEAHSLLLVPGWIGFNTKVRHRFVVVERTIRYLDTIASPATDLKLERVRGAVSRL